MRVRMLVRITGYRNMEEWPPAGGECDLPDQEAADLIASRLAVPADAGPEAADADPVSETAALKRARKGA